MKIMRPIVEDTNFNSIKVQLKLFSWLLSLRNPRYFNSIKVQLKPPAAASASVGVLFQFHKGTIKARVLFVLKAMFAYFNSIKVQLKPYTLLAHGLHSAISIP